MTQQHHEVDFAKYARVELKEQYITLLWEELRDIFKIVVRYQDKSEIPNAKLKRFNRGELEIKSSYPTFKLTGLLEGV
jgi:hypothetical protein